MFYFIEYISKIFFLSLLLSMFILNEMFNVVQHGRVGVVARLRFSLLNEALVGCVSFE